MHEPVFYAVVSVLAVSLVSLVGVFALSINQKTLMRLLLYFVGFSAGALLGDVFIHLLPEIVEEAGMTLSMSAFVMLGILVSFAVEKIVHWRHCHILTSKKHPHSFAYMNLFGDGVHNFIDGAIIMASYLVSIPVGIATTIAVIFHEIPQEIGDFGVLIHGGFSRKRALTLNFLSGVVAVVGAAVALLLTAQIENSLSYLASFAAGGFIYIAGADLIPELHKEFSVKSSILQITAIALGMLVMYGLILFE
jgi:zinc and cadmium transporter